MGKFADFHSEWPPWSRFPHVGGQDSGCVCFLKHKKAFKFKFINFLGGEFPAWLYMATFWTWFQGKNWTDSRPSTMGVRLCTGQLSRVCLLPLVAIVFSFQNWNRLWIRSAAGVLGVHGNILDVISRQKLNWFAPQHDGCEILHWTTFARVFAAPRSYWYQFSELKSVMNSQRCRCLGVGVECACVRIRRIFGFQPPEFSCSSTTTVFRMVEGIELSPNMQ